MGHFLNVVPGPFSSVSYRADYIVAELKKRGIPIERIVKVSRGGIADHVPVEVNRHTKVELFF